MKNILIFTAFFSLILFEVKGQIKSADLNPEKYVGELIEYYTEVNDFLLGELHVKMCNRKSDSKFVLSYMKVKTDYNKYLNTLITNMNLVKSKKALAYYKSKRVDNSKLKEAYKSLEVFAGSFGDEKEVSAFSLPTSITFAEITGIANAIIGQINKAKERRDARIAAIIAQLESLKIPDLPKVECN